ncbi:hypothetical protein [Mesonia maritima]|uniref:PH domain-containing protein n=1 Tax=Mesonia maritima TaxID=1793873 RepID=A0ABU1K2A7_9FLAO|nr:hypothetical protein [Mesonia maritima]MDR6299735.1 hypothetical protein [Mesonia maritima]
MEKKELKFKHKNTLQHLLFLLLGILFIIIGFVAYYSTKDFYYFYLIALANIALIYVLISSQIKKHSVVYDAVFVKYRLADQPIQRIKIDELLEINTKEEHIIITLTSHNKIEVDLSEYTENSRLKFKELLEQLS